MQSRSAWNGRINAWWRQKRVLKFATARSAPTLDGPSDLNAKGLAVAKTPLLPAQLLRQLLNYDADTGALYWKRRNRDLFESDRAWNTWNSRFANKAALISIAPHGYLYGSMLGRKYRAHRVIWAIVKGEWPPEEIDHIDHCTQNNKWANLRLASHASNGKNYSLSKRNKSGVTGVCWNKSLGKWGVRIKTDKTYKHIGLFSKFEDAVAVRKAAEIQYGYHPNHGKGRSVAGIV